MSADAAVAHGEDGTPLKGRWHTDPEQAAAGLWATPTELACLLLGIRAEWRGEEGAILRRRTARERVTPGLVSYGLGTGLDGAGGRPRARRLRYG